MDYKHDIFLSYNRRYPHEEWVNDIFYPLFIPYLEDAIGRRISVFKDTETIKSGEDWENRLKNGLAHSRCMVSILSPSYFLSEWCTKEFAIMYHRQKALGYLTVNNPTGLILPITIRNGIHFPKHINKIQSLDCRDFFRIGGGVKDTQLFIDLQSKLLEWVDEVAMAINKSPNWDKNWIKEDWVVEPIKEIKPESKPKFKKPIL